MAKVKQNSNKAKPGKKKPQQDCRADKACLQDCVTYAQNDTSLKKHNVCEWTRRGACNLCEVFGRCGGCSLLDVPYEQQLADKDARVRELFSDFQAAQVDHIIGMDDPFYYRHKVVSPYAPLPTKRNGAHKTDKVERGGKQPSKSKNNTQLEIAYGMYARGSHKLVPTDTCMLENEIGKKVTLAVRDLMRKWSIEPYDEDRGVGFMRHCVVRVGHATGEVLVVLVTNADTFPMSKSFCRELVRRVPQVTSVVQNINTRSTNAILGERNRTLYGPGFILDRLCGLSFRISAGSFYQVNPVQTEALYTKAIELAKVGPSTCVLDAYCGTGTIGLVAAARGAARVIGVDSVAAAIRDARQNASHNGIKTAEFVCDDATEFMAGDFEIPDSAAGEFVILMDPPRAGSTPEFLRAAAALAPSCIVYISCNPQTQARDAQELARVGYHLTRLSPVDMFPHTDHIESIALFEPIN